jgi:hypothetical protein
MMNGLWTAFNVGCWALALLWLTWKIFLFIMNKYRNRVLTWQETGFYISWTFCNTGMMALAWFIDGTPSILHLPMYLPGTIMCTWIPALAVGYPVGVIVQRCCERRPPRLIGCGRHGSVPELEPFRSEAERFC